MFDWNDEQLTNIIWDETGERDGGIDPCPDEIEDKPTVLYGDPTISSVEQKKPSIESEHVVELDSKSKYDYGEHEMGLGLDLWPDELDPSLSDAAKADPDSTGTAASKNLTTSSKNGSSRIDEAVKLDRDSEIFQYPPKEREQVDFIDYGWANIGSFDDLDRIFSNYDPKFGDISVVDADELWYSSKDEMNSALGPAPLSGDSFDLAIRPLRTSSIKSQYMLDPVQSFISIYGKFDEITSEDVQTFETGARIHPRRKQLDERTAATGSKFPDEGNKHKILMKGQKSDKNIELRQHTKTATWSSSGNPFGQVNTQYAPSFVNSCPPLASLQENHPSCPLLTSPTYRNPELACSGYEVAPPLKMTPEEKIDKLRRRQRMRAILAIQKQNQHFSNQVAVFKHSTMEGGNVEVNNNLDTNSPIDYDDSNTISMVFDSCLVEEAVLYQLKDTIAKLELQIRLCMRDSLFRLAKNAMQRSYDTCSKDEVLGIKDIRNHERFAGMPDVETDTNPIDRIVANLLFYRPLEFSGKPADVPESHISANIPYERETSSLESLAQDIFADSFETTQTTSPRGSKVLGLYSKGNQSIRSPCLDTSENASKNEAANEVMAQNEASK